MVVPADAGTHNHRLPFCEEVSRNALLGDHAVWVPAFAGTTREMGRRGTAQTLKDFKIAIIHSLASASRGRTGVRCQPSSCLRQ